jgi:hypothetical protein
MALWTPSDLAVPPKLRVSATNAVWSGSNLTSIANLGADGGSATIGSAGVVKGATVGSYSSLQFRADNSNLSFTLSAISQTANVSVFSLYEQASTGRFACGLFRGPGNWRSNSVIGCYPSTTGNGTLNLGRGYGGSLNQVPAYNMGSNPLAFNWHIDGYQLGTTNLLRRDGEELTITNNFAGAQTALNSDGQPNTYFVGCVSATEYLDGDLLECMFFDYFLTQNEWQRMEGWASWSYFGDGDLLPEGHPYKDAAPETTGSISVNATGSSGTSANGDVTVINGSSVTATGAAATSAIGDETVTVVSITSLTGSGATASNGTVTVLNGGAVLVNATGVAATSANGDETVVAKALVNLSGVSATSEIGNVTTLDSVTVFSIGSSATGDVGTVTVSVPFFVDVTGEQMTGDIGTVSILLDETVFAVGSEAIGHTGSGYPVTWTAVIPDTENIWTPIDA